MAKPIYDLFSRCHKEGDCLVFVGARTKTLPPIKPWLFIKISDLMVMLAEHMELITNASGPSKMGVVGTVSQGTKNLDDFMPKHSALPRFRLPLANCGAIWDWPP